jgi:hypothetical protein
MRTENAAQLGAIFGGRKPAEVGPSGITWPPAAVLAVQKAARILHRNAERACGEDCGCPTCQGQGDTMRADGGGREDCRACAGTGQTFGKREARLMERVRAVCSPYRLRVYEQGDPRGWPLYLIPEEAGPRSEDGSWYSSRGFAVCPH